MDSEEALSQYINAEAKKKGLSTKDAKKAIKKLKSGGMMGQVAPQLHSQFMEMNPNMTPKEKLRMKMRKLKESRGNKVAKTASYEKTREEVHKRKKQELEDKVKAKQDAVARKRNHRKKIKDLGKKLGIVTQEMYNKCMINLQNNTYDDPSMVNRDRNIVELYGVQQEFKESIDLNDLDDI